jgi:hypothetical protein
LDKDLTFPRLAEECYIRGFIVPKQANLQKKSVEERLIGFSAMKAVTSMSMDGMSDV